MFSPLIVQQKTYIGIVYVQFTFLTIVNRKNASLNAELYTEVVTVGVCQAADLDNLFAILPKKATDLRICVFHSCQILVFLDNIAHITD